MFDTCSFKPTNDGFPPSSGGGGGAVTSVFGRTGVVIAVAGDYTSSEITNSSTVTGTYVTDALNTLDTGKLSTTLTNGNIIVGNGSNVATAVAMSGDATIINTGALTISNQAVTFSKMQHISTQHLVGRHAAGTGDIQQISLGTGLSFSGANLQVTGFVPTTLTSANIIVGNNLGVATAVAMSGDTTINNTGAVTISNDAVTTAKILNSNVTYAKIQNVAATRLLGNSTGSPAAPEEITLGTNLSFTGTTLNVTGVVSDTLTSANIIVGNNLGVATAVAMSGDITISNTGATTIGTAKVTTAKILDRNVTFGKIQDLNPNTLIGRGASVFGAAQEITLGTNLSFTGTTLNVTGFVPTTLTSANIIVGNNLGVATAVAMSGDTTISNIGAVTISNDAVTTAKILNSNVTYAKIQNVAATRLLGNSTGSPAAPEEITLGTNLSFTGTTLNAAGGGGYTYLAITLSADTTYNKAALGGANYLFISTNNATIRTITIDSTGFVANDFLVLSFNEESLGLINLTIGTTPRTFNNNRGNTVFAIYNGTQWVLQLMASSYNTTAVNNSQLAIGLGAYVNTSNSTAVGIGANTTFGSGTALGASASAGAGAVAIGSGATSSGNFSVSVGQGNTGSGANTVRIGAGTQTGTNTGVVAIGQGITSTNSDNVVIGRQAGASGTNTVAIGGSVSGIGANTIAIGIGGSYGSGASAVYIGASISTLASNSVIIGASASGAANSVVVGRANSVAGANTVAIGDGITTSTNTGVVAIGQGITTTNTDAVVIGRAASAGGTANVTIGGSATGTGNSTVRIGASVATNNAPTSVAIGQGVTIGTGGAQVVAIGQGANTNTASGATVIGQGASTTSNEIIVIGRGASTTGVSFNSVVIGAAITAVSTSTCVLVGYNIIVLSSVANSVVIGPYSTSRKNQQFAKGYYSYPRHFGAESRRLDSNNDSTDATNPSRHNENTAWIVQTPNATPVTMTLFGVAGERLTLQDNEAMHFDIMVTAKQTGSTNTFITRIAGGAVRGAGVGTTSIVGQTTLYTHGTALTAVVSADTVNGAVQIQVTGNASVWEWTASVDYQRTRTA